MSILVVQIPPRRRLRAQASDDAGGGAATEFDYALSSDGIGVTSQGRCAPSLLPKASTVVAVLSDADVSWHRITLPKAPAQRLRAALTGVLEESLVDDDVHLAVAPRATAGQPTWVAAVQRSWLAATLGRLEKDQVFVDRVVPLSWPDDPPSGHFVEDPDAPGDSPAALVLTWAHADGVATLKLQGGLARAVLPQPLPDGLRWSASPAAALGAGAWLGAPVAVMTPTQRGLQAVRTTWNLRQFDLAPRNRGMRALRDLRRQAFSPNWRALRFGLVGLLVVHLVGINLWALGQQAAVERRQAAMVSLLRETFPQVRTVVDAPVQMQREVDSLRATAGQAGDGDLEPLLQAAASAWPPDRPPVETLRFEPGRLTLGASGWDNEEIERFRARLRPAGWEVDAIEGRLVLSRAQAGSGAS